MAGWYIWYRTADAAWRKEAKVEMGENDEAEKEDENEDESEKGSVRSSQRSQSIKSGKR
jgi:hypothetical protein